MRWQELFDDLLGRSAGRLIEPLRRQVRTAMEILDELVTDAADDTLVAVDVTRIQKLEDRADEAHDDVLSLASRSLSTPIDREDMFLLSRSLDDVVDNVRDFVVEVARYGVQDSTRFVAPLRALREGCAALDEVLGGLGGDPSVLARSARRAKHANTSREAFHDEMAKLLSGDLSMAVLRDRELLRRLDVAGLRLGEAADALASGAMKRG